MGLAAVCLLSKQSIAPAYSKQQVLYMCCVHCTLLCTVSVQLLSLNFLMVVRTRNTHEIDLSLHVAGGDAKVHCVHSVHCTACTLYSVYTVQLLSLNFLVMAGTRNTHEIDLSLHVAGGGRGDAKVQQKPHDPYHPTHTAQFHEPTEQSFYLYIFGQNNVPFLSNQDQRRSFLVQNAPTVTM